MKIEILKEPFDHVIINEVLTPEQLKNVWLELEFLYPRLQRVGENNYKGGSAQAPDGTLLKKNKCMNLHDVYNFQFNVSYILECLIDLHKSEELNNSIQDLEYYFRLFKKIRTYFFMLQYYEDSDNYQSHRDNCAFTSVLFLHKEPKNFTGGNFVFDEYSYSVPFETNKMILFPSVLNHAVTPVKLLSDDPMGGRFSITTLQYLKD